MPVLERPGAQPEAAAQLAVDVPSAEERQAGAKVVVQQQVLRVAVVAPQAVQVQRREPQKMLAQQVLPPPADWGRSVPEGMPVLRPARRELAAEQPVSP